MLEMLASPCFAKPGTGKPPNPRCGAPLRHYFTAGLRFPLLAFQQVQIAGSESRRSLRTP